MESRYINLKTEVFSYSLILPIEYGSPGDAEVIIGSPGEFIPKRTYSNHHFKKCSFLNLKQKFYFKVFRYDQCTLPADDDGLTGSFSSVIYPGGGVSVIGKVALSGIPVANASSRLGRSGRSVGICVLR